MRWSGGRVHRGCPVVESHDGQAVGDARAPLPVETGPVRPHLLLDRLDGARGSVAVLVQPEALFQGHAQGSGAQLVVESRPYQLERLHRQSRAGVGVVTGGGAVVLVDTRHGGGPHSLEAVAPVERLAPPERSDRDRGADSLSGRETGQFLPRCRDQDLERDVREDERLRALVTCHDGTPLISGVGISRLRD